MCILILAVASGNASADVTPLANARFAWRKPKDRKNKGMKTLTQTDLKPGLRCRRRDHRGFTFELVAPTRGFISNTPKWYIRFRDGGIGRITTDALLETCKVVQ